MAKQTATTLPDVEHGSKDSATTWNYRRLMASILARACYEIYFEDSEEARRWILESEVAAYLLDFLNLPSGEVLLERVEKLPYFPKRGHYGKHRAGRRREYPPQPAPETLT